MTPRSGSGDIIRPTSDRVREALFSILGSHIEQSRVLDLFAGTGCLGIEALSRGASEVVFVDRHTLSLDIVRNNLHTCFKEVHAQIIRLDLARETSYFSLKKRLSAQKKFNFIFMDPPYDKKLAETALTMVEKTELLAQEGSVIVEKRWDTPLPEKTGILKLQKKRRYGETGIWIYQPSHG